MSSTKVKLPIDLEKCFLDYTDTLKELKGSKDAYRYFDDFELFYYLSAREYLGQYKDFLTEEEKQKIKEADRTAVELAEKIKNPPYASVFRYVKKLIEKYPL